MSKWERNKKIMHNLEPTLVNRTAAEQIDDYQMRIYEIVKEVFSDAIGYSAKCSEEDGYIRTSFRVHRKPIRLGEEERVIDEKLKAALMDAYRTGWREGFADACDTIASGLAEIKKAAQETKTKGIDKLEEKE